MGVGWILPMAIWEIDTSYKSPRENTISLNLFWRCFFKINLAKIFSQCLNGCNQWEIFFKGGQQTLMSQIFILFSGELEMSMTLRI